jgi:hypothetical protein
MSVPTFSPSWSTDQSDEASCKLAGEFFATWMTTPDQIEADTYRGPGMEVTYEYLKILSGAESATKGELLHWFADSQDQAWAGSEEDSQEFINAFIQPALDYCGASVCKSLGWTGNNDLAGIGVSSLILCLSSTELQQNKSDKCDHLRSSYPTMYRLPW